MYPVRARATPLGPHPFDPLSLRERGNEVRPSFPLSTLWRGGQGVRTTPQARRTCSSRPSLTPPPASVCAHHSVGAQVGLVPASRARERSRVNVSPVLALAGLAAIGLLATRLPRPAWRRVPSLDLVLAAGGPLVCVGLVLGPGIGFVSASLLRALAPVTALALGSLGATLGAQFEWRYVRRIPRDVWLLAAWSAASGFAAVALAAALLARLVPALGMVWTPRLPVIVTLAAVAAASGPGAVTLVARTLGLGELGAPRVAP